MTLFLVRCAGSSSSRTRAPKHPMHMVRTDGERHAVTRGVRRHGPGRRPAETMRWQRPTPVDGRLWRLHPESRGPRPVGPIQAACSRWRMLFPPRLPACGRLARRRQHQPACGCGDVVRSGSRLSSVASRRGLHRRRSRLWPPGPLLLPRLPPCGRSSCPTSLTPLSGLAGLTRACGEARVVHDCGH